MNLLLLNYKVLFFRILFVCLYVCQRRRKEDEGFMKSLPAQRTQNSRTRRPANMYNNISFLMRLQPGQFYMFVRDSIIDITLAFTFILCSFYISSFCTCQRKIEVNRTISRSSWTISRSLFFYVYDPMTQHWKHHKHL